MQRDHIANPLLNVRWAQRSLVVLTGIAAVAGGLGYTGDARAQTEIAVEYYHAGWDHYFVTAFPEEIAALDAGAFAGVWKRTGLTFDVWSGPVAGTSPTCRFFSTSFAPKSSHFYTPFADECASVKGNSDWQFEAVSFSLQLPDVGGGCTPGTSELYRLYNNGMGAAPNHRYTISTVTLNQIRDAGWTAEGDGVTGVFACVPEAAPSVLPASAVVVGARPLEVAQFPSSNQGWQIEYKYRVPPLPSSPTWDPGQHTFYVWGDVDFDWYGDEGPYKLSDYRFNHIVPLLFVGRGLSGNDANFSPSWTQVDTWSIQAQYYWQKGATPYAQTGSIVGVEPGAEITTSIGFDATNGKLTVSVAAAAGRSFITLDRPFPNEPGLFANWTDFFQKAEQKSQFIHAHPVVAIQPFADRQTMCSILPLQVDRIAIPSVATSWTEFLVSNTGGLSCGKPVVILAF
jgi:hypothetical protein